MKHASIHGTSSVPTAPTAPPKVLVAVHGIGDQIGYATVQSVASRISAYYGIAPAIPLGRFYPPGQAGAAPRPGPTLMASPPDPKALTGIGFAEVYWADIAREVTRDGYILEESKKWAHTITARLALRAAEAGDPLPPREHDRLVTVLDELIDVVFVLERLTWVADRAGLFKFNLKTLLADFLGDVQIVADFVGYRQRILAEFDTVMKAALQLKSGGQDPNLYLVAHSEGSVVAFLALLTALSQPSSAHPWIRSVRGFMTIGSPIETHHLLWPNLWSELRPHSDHAGVCIPWCNYFDYGDPIAYSLTETNRWLARTGWRQHLDLSETAFSRSYFPGKAHIDYWEDDGVFGHFIETVVIPPAETSGTTGSEPVSPPGDRFWATVVSYALPQALIAALLFAGTYLLYRPVVAARAASPAAGAVVADVGGIGLLLLGMTAASRIARLTDQYRWWLLSAILLMVSMGVYSQLTTDATRDALGYAFEHSPLSAWTPEIPAWSIDRATAGILLLATSIVVVCGSLASWLPFWGVRLLPIAGAVATAGLIGTLLRRTLTGRDAEIWPIVLGGAAFFYLWWLAAMLFDLVFVWQRYVRHSAAVNGMERFVTRGYQPAPSTRLAAAVMTHVWRQ